MNYFTAVMYPQQDAVALKELLIKAEVEGRLAAEQGLHNDRFYRHFKLLKQRSRQATAAEWYVKNKYPDDSDNGIHETIYRLLDFKPGGLLSFCQAAGQSAHNLNCDAADVILGSYTIPGGDGRQAVSQADLEQVLLFDEYQNLLSVKSEYRGKVLKGLLVYLFNAVLDKAVLQHFGAAKTEIERNDHNSLAAEFLASRYGKAGKGIYPVAVIQTRLMYKEVLHYFASIKNRLWPVKKITYRYNFFNDPEQASVCYQKKLPLPADSKVRTVSVKSAAADRVSAAAVYTVSRQQTFASPEEINGRHLCLEVIEVTRGEPPEFEKHKSLVENELSRQILNEQFRIDILDTRRQMGLLN